MTLRKYVSIVGKILKIKKILIGHVAYTNPNGLVKCGGAVANQKKMHQVANLVNMKLF